MRQWIERYDAGEVKQAAPTTSMLLASSAATIACSTTLRALSSARALKCKTFVADSVFCEAQLPFSNWLGPRLPVSFWVVFFRLLWFVGYAKNSDSIQTTSARAKGAARTLVSHAETGPVLLIGHGVMNRLIGRELVALGWATTSPKTGGSYWSTSTYEPSHP